MSSAGGGVAQGGTLEEEQKKAGIDDVFQYPETGIGPVLAAIEGSVRCSICRKIPQPPLSLPCCPHVYCPICIRDHVDNAGARCPQCRGSAAQNQVKANKGLRSICSIWKQHRSSMLAAAVANAEAEGGGAASVVASDEVEEEEDSGNKKLSGGRRGVKPGRITRGLFYHSMKEPKLREQLQMAGLPTHGSKNTMVARHKRLILMDTISNDGEIPVPRAEQIKEVMRWEAAEEKKRRAAAARDARVAGSAGQDKNGEPPEQTQEQKDFFKTLLKNHKRGRGSDGDGGGKKRRAWRDPEDEDGPAVGSGASGSSAVGGSAVGSSAVGNGAVGNGTVGSRAVGSGAVGNGAVGSDCVVTPPPERPVLMVDPIGEGARSSGAEAAAAAAAAVAASSGGVQRISPVPGSSQLKADGGDAAEMRILGVAGKMVRTHGPWRCVFSRGALASGARRDEAGDVGTAEEEPPTPATSAGDPGADASTSAGGGRGEDRLLLPPPSASLSPVPSPPSGVVAREGHSAAVVGPVAAGGATSGGDTLSVRCHGTGAVGDAEQGDGDGGGGGGRTSSRGGLDAPPLEEEGIVYVNAATGESAREPPAELLAQAAEAEKAGGYLVFIPCRNFVAAAAAAVGSSSAATAAASAPSIPRMSGAASGVGSGVGTLLPTAGRSNAAGSRDEGGKPVGEGGGGGGGGKQDRWALNKLSTPSPPIADAPAAPGGSGGGGGGSVETWDRLSAVSAAGTTPSHPCVPLPRPIDLSQGAPAPPLLVGHDGDGGSTGSAGSGGGGRGKGDVEVLSGGSGTEAARDTWTCVACTLNNGVRHSACVVCGTARPKAFRSQRLAQSSSSCSSATSGSGSRRAQSRLRLPAQRANGDSAPQSAITSFTSRPGIAVKSDSSISSSSTSRGCGDGEGGGGDCEMKE